MRRHWASTQSIEVIVTDSGCISAPRETSILVLERPEIQLDYLCLANKAVEVVVSVETFTELDLDNHAGELENSVFNPPVGTPFTSFLTTPKTAKASSHRCACACCGF